jgi:hypothetical protein
MLCVLVTKALWVADVAVGRLAKESVNSMIKSVDLFG